MEFPRHVHKAGVDSLIVGDAPAFADALAAGWSPAPVGIAIQKGDERHDVYTANQLQTALEQGWSIVDGLPPAVGEPVSDADFDAATAAVRADTPKPKNKGGRPKKIASSTAGV
jgi:hypothetical protein